MSQWMGVLLFEIERVHVAPEWLFQRKTFWLVIRPPGAHGTGFLISTSGT
jgi:hypothetical protein